MQDKVRKLAAIVQLHEDLWSKMYQQNPRSTLLKRWFDDVWNPWYGGFMELHPTIGRLEADSFVQECSEGLSGIRETAVSWNLPIPDLGSKGPDMHYSTSRRGVSSIVGWHGLGHSEGSDKPNRDHRGRTSSPPPPRRGSGPSVRDQRSSPSRGSSRGFSTVSVTPPPLANPGGTRRPTRTVSTSATPAPLPIAPINPYGASPYYDPYAGYGYPPIDPYANYGYPPPAPVPYVDPYAGYYDPYAMDPYAGYYDPYAMDPYAMDPYAEYYDPYAMDPYAMDPYAGYDPNAAQQPAPIVTRDSPQGGVSVSGILSSIGKAIKNSIKLGASLRKDERVKLLAQGAALGLGGPGALMAVSQADALIDHIEAARSGDERAKQTLAELNALAKSGNESAEKLVVFSRQVNYELAKKEGPDAAKKVKAA